MQIINFTARNSFLLACLVISFLAPSLVLAQSGVATVVDAATIFENEPNDNGGIYGEICVGNLAGTAATRRAFVRFELPEIPDGAIITRVFYEMIQIRPRGNCLTCPKVADIEIRRVLEDWAEGLGGINNAACGGGTNVPGVTWNSAPAVQSQASATEFMPAGFSIPITIDTDVGNDDDGLIADVQAWVNNPASNYGWEYRVGDENDADNARLVNPTSFTIYWMMPVPLEFGDGFESP